jgi:hypothetical protein
VRYVDHASAPELRRKYSTDQGMRDRLDQIVEVDYVLGETMTIAEAVAGDTANASSSEGSPQTRWIVRGP